MQQAFNLANKDHPLAYFYSFILVIRCCCSGLCNLLICFSNSQPVSLQKDSGRGMFSLTLSLHSRPCLCCFSGEMLILQCFTSAFGSICDNCVSDHHNLTQLLSPREREPQKHMGLEKLVCFTAHGHVSETTDPLVFHRKDMAPQNLLEVSQGWDLFFSTGAAEMQ